MTHIKLFGVNQISEDLSEISEDKSSLILSMDLKKSILLDTNISLINSLNRFKDDSKCDCYQTLHYIKENIDTENPEHLRELLLKLAPKTPSTNKCHMININYISNYEFRQMITKHPEYIPCKI